MDAWTRLARIDRAAHLRTADGMASSLADPRALEVAVDPRSRISVRADGLDWRPPVAEGARILLGLLDGAPRFARLVAADDTLASLREAALALSPEDLELAMSACALASWHAAEQFCGRCGTATTMAPGGFSRACPGCGAEHFPRHDPAMIVAVVDADDRLLLGHQASWAPTRFSLLAGFAEAGESIEQAVHREVFEEAGVRLSAMRYLASQPWPFPRSLMVAFVARAGAVDLVPDGVEIQELRWFSRDEYDAAIADGSISVPAASVSVAAWVIDAWRRGTLPAPESA